MNILAAMQRWITRLDQSFLGAVGGVTAEVLVCCRLLILRLFCSLLSISTPIEAMGDIETMLMMFGCIVLLFYETKIDIKRLELGMMTVVNIIKAMGE